ncbi:PsiF family protein [Rhodoblastus sp.]|uniref:PsiF family protein n=1 Tax=Rhodoblastus sp. TaxID=1962975 RepID=UPI0035B197DB
MKLTQSILLASFLAFSGAAYADPAAPAAPAAAAPAAAPAAPAAKAPAKPRSAKSLECSKQADSQNLHGKPRKQFMSTCKKS